jgi:murein DD-endopeptidase MepM/ murein hydrolase activator NlpD
MKIAPRLKFGFFLPPILPCFILLGGGISPNVGIAAPFPSTSTALSSVQSNATHFAEHPTVLLAQTESLCQEPALSRLSRHRIASGETLETIAQQYSLLPATLQGFNPSLRSGNAPVGTEIIIPPYNGVQVNAPAGTTWRDLARVYRVRADALFEVNGCQDEVPSVVFVPGVNWSPTQPASDATAAISRNPLSGYPLPTIANVLTSYGWQLDPSSNELVFQSGVNLQAAAGTPVLSVGAGTVAFAGAESNDGNLVVVNHSQGLQTRYAQLGDIAVQVGQQVQSGDRVGVVGSSVVTPYLHFEVRSNSTLGWVAQDPGAYIPDIRNADQIRRRPQAGNGQ